MTNPSFFFFKSDLKGIRTDSDVFLELSSGVGVLQFITLNKGIANTPSNTDGVK